MEHVLRAIAEELAAKAKASMPELQDGERILSESYEDGIYTRKTTLGIAQYDFRKRQ